MTCPHCLLEDRGGLHGPQFCIEVLEEVISRVYAGGPMVLPRGPVDHEAYRAGRCIDCSVEPCSAGRPRCEDCHRRHVEALPSMTPQLNRAKPSTCGVSECRNPALPGRVLCGPCRRSKEP